jgi:thymidylate synthase (FAD)
MLEHASISIKVICDRGVSHEIVRHRLAAYAQESTRYCNYSKDKFDKEITVIDPSGPFGWEKDDPRYKIWEQAMRVAESAYFDLLSVGATAQEARDVLPNSLKTEIVITANIREWRHFLQVRCAPAAHPQMREIALCILAKFVCLVPVVFDDIFEQYKDNILLLDNGNNISLGIRLK